jgi:hypothetical protein
VPDGACSYKCPHVSTVSRTGNCRHVGCSVQHARRAGRSARCIGPCTSTVLLVNLLLSFCQGVPLQLWAAHAHGWNQRQNPLFIASVSCSINSSWFNSLNFLLKINSLNLGRDVGMNGAPVIFHPVRLRRRIYSVVGDASDQTFADWRPGSSSRLFIHFCSSFLRHPPCHLKTSVFSLFRQRAKVACCSSGDE